MIFNIKQTVQSQGAIGNIRSMNVVDNSLLFHHRVLLSKYFDIFFAHFCFVVGEKLIAYRHFRVYLPGS